MNIFKNLITKSVLIEENNLEDNLEDIERSLIGPKSVSEFIKNVAIYLKIKKMSENDKNMIKFFLWIRSDDTNRTIKNLYKLYTDPMFANTNPFNSFSHLVSNQDISDLLSDLNFVTQIKKLVDFYYPPEMLFKELKKKFNKSKKDLKVESVNAVSDAPEYFKILEKRVKDHDNDIDSKFDFFIGGSYSDKNVDKYIKMVLKKIFYKKVNDVDQDTKDIIAFFRWLGADIDIKKNIKIFHKGVTSAAGYDYNFYTEDNRNNHSFPDTLIVSEAHIKSIFNKQSFRKNMEILFSTYIIKPKKDRTASYEKQLKHEKKIYELGLLKNELKRLNEKIKKRRVRREVKTTLDKKLPSVIVREINEFSSFIVE